MEIYILTPCKCQQNVQTNCYPNFCHVMKENMVSTFKYEAFIQRDVLCQANLVVCWLVVELAFKENRRSKKLEGMAFTLAWLQP